MDYEIETCLRKYGKFSDLSLDWLIKSWSLRDEDKIIALAYYKKAVKVRSKLSQRLAELTDKKYGKNT